MSQTMFYAALTHEFLDATAHIPSIVGAHVNALGVTACSTDSNLRVEGSFHGMHITMKHVGSLDVNTEQLSA